MLRIAGVLLVVLVILAFLEHLFQISGGTKGAGFFLFVGAAVVAVGLAVVFVVIFHEAVFDALPSVNLAVVLIAFVGLECTLATLSLQKSDIESLPPDEQVRQFRYAEGGFLYHLFGNRTKAPTEMNEQYEAYYRVLSEKFAKDFGEHERRTALNAQQRALEDKNIEDFIRGHEPLLNGVFAFMRVSGLFHAHSAWWFRFTLALLALNLIVCTIDRYRGRLRQTGFLLTHTGILVVFVGAMVGAWFEQKGMMQFHVGDTANAFHDQRHNQEVRLGFALQLANFKTINHKELFVQFLDVNPASLPPDAKIQNAYKVQKGKDIALDDAKLHIRVLDTVPEAVLESEFVNRSQEPKNPAIEIKVGAGNEAEHAWLLALKDEESVYAEKMNAFKIKFARADSDAALQAELAKAKESRWGTLTLRSVKENKEQTFPVVAHAKVVLGEYTIEVSEIRPDFRMEGVPPEQVPPRESRAVRLTLTKGADKEDRWIFEKFDFEQFHPSKFTDLKVNLRMPVWEAPCKVKYLVVVKGDAFSAYTVEGPTVTGPVPVKVGEAAPIDKTGAALTIQQYFPHAELEQNIVPILAKPPGGPEHAGMSEMAQPAVQLQIKDSKGEKTTWLLANSPEKSAFELPGYARIVYQDNTDKMPLEWRAHLLFLEEGEVVYSGVARVNHPVQFRGYSFYQTDANKDDPTYSGIQVIHDPSWPVVNLGLLAVIVGVLFTFYVKPYLKTSATPSQSAIRNPQSAIRKE
jgi:hypothetical protein